MVIKEEQERVRTLLSDTITLLCRNGLTFKSEFNISALIGITLDKDEVFLVDIRETIKNEATVEEEPAEQSDASSTVSTDKKSQKKRKRRRNKSKDKGGGGDSVANSDQEDVEQLHSDGDEPPEKNVKHEDDDNDSEDLVFVKNEPANPAISINNSLQAEQYGSSAMPQAYRDMNSWDAANMSAGLPSTSSNMAAGQPLSLGDVTQISPVNTSSAAAQTCQFWELPVKDDPDGVSETDDSKPPSAVINISRGNTSWSLQFKRKAIERVELGSKREDVAKQMGIPIGTLRHWIKHAGEIKNAYSNKRLSKVFLANSPSSITKRQKKFCDLQVKYAALMRVSSCPQEKKAHIAREFGIPANTLSTWIKNSFEIVSAYNKEQKRMLQFKDQ